MTPSSPPSPFEAMQYAVDIVGNSEHPTNKISACLVATDGQWIARCNHRPDIFKTHFDWDTKLGSSSQFLHAEMACIFHADFPVTNASLYITDPMCPNCAKAIAESGIKHVYIDHKGMEKDFIKRRGNDFEGLSLLMMQRAGINISIIYRKEHKIEPLKQTIQAVPLDITPIEISTKYAQTTINDKIITVYEGLPPNITQDDADNCTSNKYRFYNDPLTRLLIHLSSHHLHTGTVTCSHHPSSRALVNAVGYGIKEITVQNAITNHGHHGIDSGRLLQKNNIIILKNV